MHYHVKRKKILFYKMNMIENLAFQNIVQFENLY